MVNTLPVPNGVLVTVAICEYLLSGAVKRMAIMAMQTFAGRYDEKPGHGLCGSGPPRYREESNGKNTRHQAG